MNINTFFSMATIADKTIKVETPESANDSNYEEFEFMLAWYGRDGSFYNYLFTDWEEGQDVEARALNLSTQSKLSSIILSEQRPVKLTAEDLSLNDLKVIGSILVAKKIIRVFKDGTTERIGLVGNSQEWRQTNAKYNFSFNILQYEKALSK